MISSTNRIEKRVLLASPQEEVWRAISDGAEFGSWFGVELDGSFVRGSELVGRIKPTKADPEVAKMQEQHAGLRIAFYVDRVEPMHVLSFRWHPFAIDPAVDYSDEPMTVVTFTLELAHGGTMLTIVESGFDAIPLDRRVDAFEANEEGWELMTQLVAKHLSQLP